MPSKQLYDLAFIHLHKINQAVAQVQRILVSTPYDRNK